jgi:uncharacterized membrane protein
VEKESLGLSEPKPPQTLVGYALSLRNSWFWTLTVLVMLATFIMFYVTDPLIYMRYVLGSIFVLYLPGSILIKALYPRREDLESFVELV